MTDGPASHNIPTLLNAVAIASLSLEEVHKIQSSLDRYRIASSTEELVSAFDSFEPRHVAVIWSCYLGAKNDGFVPGDLVAAALLSEDEVIRSFGERGLAVVGTVTDHLVDVVWRISEDQSVECLRGTAVTLLQAIQRREQLVRERT